MKRDWSYCSLLLSLSGALFLWGLGGRALWNPDEGRYAEIAREMLALGDWVVPHLNLVPYLEKPPLFCWLTAFCLHIFGTAEWVPRLVPALSALGGVALVYDLGRRLDNPRSGFLSALTLATSLEYYALARFVVLDMLLTFFITLGLWLFYRGHREADRRKVFWRSMYIAFALGTLTKGFVALVLPLLVISLFLCLSREAKLLKKLEWRSGLGIYALLVTPWYIAIALRNQEFLYFHIVEEQLGRFLTHRHGRGGFFLYYVPVLLAGFFPWTLHLLASFRKAKENLFLISWFGGIVGFFSLSGSQLLTYILPAFPAGALLAGRLWESRIRNGETRLIFFGMMAGAAALLYTGLGPTLRKFEPRFSDKTLALAAAKTLRPEDVLMVYDANAARPYERVSLFKLRPHPAFGEARLRRPALFPEERGIFKLPLPLGERDRVRGREDAAYYSVYERRLQSLLYYTGRRVMVAGNAGELTWGSQWSEEGYFLTQDGAQKILKSSRRVVAVAHSTHYQLLQKDFPRPLPILARQADLVLFTNR